MRKFAVLFISLAAVLTAQAATAAEHRYTRSQNRAAISEQVRNSYAYGGRPDTSVRNMPDYDDGAMASGVAGH